MMILAVFRSRAHSLDYVERLKRYGINGVTVPTPKEVHIGCGLCVRFDARYFVRAKAILNTGRYTSFKGFYKVEYPGGRISVTPYNG